MLIYKQLQSQRNTSKQQSVQPEIYLNNFNFSVDFDQQITFFQQYDYTDGNNCAGQL